MTLARLWSLTATNLVIAFLAIAIMSGAEARQIYTVQSGDTLSRVAQQFYGNSASWRLIYDANREQVRGNGDLIFVGDQLVIPGVEQASNTAYRAPYGQLDETTGLEEIDLVTGSDFTPWTDENLPNGGMITEIVEAAFRELGFLTVVEFINWPSGYRLTNKGKFAATFPYALTSEREEDFHYSDSVYDTLSIVYSRSDSDFRFETLEDLQGLSVCRPAGYFTSFIDEMIQSGQIRIVQPKSLEECYEALIDKEIDVVIIAELEGNAKLRQMGIADQVTVSEAAANIGGLHVIFPKSIAQSARIVGEFNRILREMAKSGQLNEIVKRHLQLYYTNFGA